MGCSNVYIWENLENYICFADQMHNIAFDSFIFEMNLDGHKPKYILIHDLLKKFGPSHLKKMSARMH